MEENNKELLNFAVVKQTELPVSNMVDGGVSDYFTNSCKWVKWGMDNKLPQFLFDS